MIKIPSFPTFQYEKETYNEFISDYDKYNTPVVDFGVSSDPDFNIYGFKIGDFNLNKPVIFIVGAMHGSEWQSAYWTRRFFEYLDNPNNAAVNRKYLNQLLGTFNFIVIPIMSPYGFEHLTRPNANGVDPERNFPVYWEEWDPAGDPNRQKGDEPFDQPETILFRDIVLEHGPFMVLDGHSRGGFTGIASHVQEGAVQYDALFNEMLSSTGLTSNNMRVHPMRVQQPFSITWLQTINSNHGKRIIGLIPEIGNQETEEDQGQFGTNMLLMYCIYAHHFFHTRTMKKYNL